MRTGPNGTPFPLICVVCHGETDGLDEMCPVCLETLQAACEEAGQPEAGPLPDPPSADLREWEAWMAEQ